MADTNPADNEAPESDQSNDLLTQFKKGELPLGQCYEVEYKTSPDNLIAFLHEKDEKSYIVTAMTKSAAGRLQSNKQTNLAFDKKTFKSIVMVSIENFPDLKKKLADREKRRDATQISHTITKDGNNDSQPGTNKPKAELVTMETATLAASAEPQTEPSAPAEPNTPEDSGAGDQEPPHSQEPAPQLSLLNKWIQEWQSAEEKDKLVRLNEQIALLTGTPHGTQGEEMKWLQKICERIMNKLNAASEKSNPMQNLLPEFREGGLEEGKCYKLTFPKDKPDLIVYLWKKEIEDLKAFGQTAKGKYHCYYEVVGDDNTIKIVNRHYPYPSNMLERVENSIPIPPAIAGYLQCQRDGEAKLATERTILRGEKDSLEKKHREMEAGRLAQIEKYNQRVSNLSGWVQTWKDANLNKKDELFPQIDEQLKETSESGMEAEMGEQWKLLRALWEIAAEEERRRAVHKADAEDLVKRWEQLNGTNDREGERKKLAGEFIALLKIKNRISYVQQVNAPQEDVVKSASEQVEKIINNKISHANAKPSIRGTTDNLLFHLLEEVSGCGHLEQQRLLDYFDHKTLLNFSEWVLQPERKRLSLGLVDTLNERFARLFRTYEQTKDYDSHRELGDVLFSLVKGIDEKSKEAYYWRLFLYLQEAWAHLSALAGKPGNDTGGAYPYLEWMLKKTPKFPAPIQFLMLKSLLDTPDSYAPQHQELLARSIKEYIESGKERSQARYNEIHTLIPFGSPFHKIFSRILYKGD